MDGEAYDTASPPSVASRRPSPSACAGAVVALLAGLEEQAGPAQPAGPALGQQAGGPDEHGGVGVVPAGVHAAVDGGA